MKKNIWIWNHYATNTIKDMGGRHYWISENLIKKGYNVTVFCASTIHNSDEAIDTNGKSYTLKHSNSVKYVVVNTPRYADNGINRILNMITFYRKLFPTALKYSEEDRKPDIILASSVHPLTLAAGIKIANKFRARCICEVRDLWPESIIDDIKINKDGLISKLLYFGEKWIYQRADSLIFTMEGGKDYIIDKRWNIENGGLIDLNKVYHINNGIDLISYDENIKNYSFNDIHLDNPNIFKVVYAGSVRKANNLSLVINAAKYVQNNSEKDIRFLIFGDGDEKEILQKKCADEKIDNVIFKGKVGKQYIPNILSKSNLNILNYTNDEIWKYGGSQNKNFEYLASGKPILSTIRMGYDIIERYNAGISLHSQTSKSIGEAIISISQMEESKYDELSKNARKAAKDYDFKILTDKLINIIEEV